MASWTTKESETLYNVPNWGVGFFHLNEAGALSVTPDDRKPERSIDVHKLLQQLLRRGIQAPILMRFDGILRSRVRQLNEAFEKARAEYKFEGSYRTVFPIKVNQERHVVEAMLKEGKDWGMGLEAGSKPELVAVMALQAGEGTFVVCNGYKDLEYIEMALLATKLGITPILVIEKFSELHDVLEAAERLQIDPVIGVRSKLSYRGAGRWQDSGGDRSKFGLTTSEIVRVVETLKERGKLSCLGMLHFHLGSQITNIRSFKNGLREAARTLVGLTEMGAHIRWFDVGGGLGVDYDGSSTNFESSMNYTEQEYANDVVAHVADACADAGITPPCIVSESGRALAAHHAVLITEVLGTTSPIAELPHDLAVREDDSDVVRSLAETLAGITAKNYQESYHDALEFREEAMLLFNVGQLSIPQRARVDEFFWSCCRRIARVVKDMPYVPDDLERLERDLSSTYFLNFSLFQSLPDSWAIQQLFPVLPIHRHTEEPTVRATLA
ncbi:MAG: biosynthetic arginine decarboxylase, partial [Planctomycetota bacterium]